MSAAPQPAKKNRPSSPVPPRAVLLMDAPTNNIVASHFINKGYSVEIVRDLKYCATPLLKSAKYIILNPDENDSPFYNKIRLTLQKMVPDRLFEQTGQDLLSAIREKINNDIQPVKKHPKDDQLKADKREKEDAEALAEIEEDNEEAPAPETEIDRIEEIKLKIYEHLLEDEAKTELDSHHSKTVKLENYIECDDSIREQLKPFMTICSLLAQIDAEREKLLKEELDEKAKEALQNQSSSFKKPSAPERFIKKYEDTLAKAEEAKAEGKEFPKRKLPEGELYDTIIDLGKMQDDLMYMGIKIKTDIAKWFASTTVKDYCFRILKSVGVDASELHGSIYFFFALHAYRNEVLADFKSTSKKLQAIINEKPDDKKSGGLGGLFKKKKAEPVEEVPMTDEEISLRKDTCLYGYAINQIDSEINRFEPILCNAYWDAYEKAMLITVQEKIQNKSFLRYVRAFLRFGLIGDHPSLVSDEQKKNILNLCDEDQTDFAHDDGITNTIYPDEFMKQIVKETIPPSFDEELELNGQGTPRYKYDKIKRKMYSSRFKIQIFTREINRWQSKIDEQKKAVESAEQMLSEHEKGTKEYKLVQTSMREAKAETARLKKVMEKLQTTIDNENETLETQEESIKAIDHQEEIGNLISAEVKTLRKYCKLLANLKEPFFPFVLRDGYKPDSPTLFDRNVTSDALKEFEANDPTIFSIDLANAQNPRKQVMIRYSPAIVMIPCAGMQGFCIAPSSGADTGRFVLPIMSIQQIPLMRMIIEMCADFRYDTAKENAGVDLMTSDTICAAYAKVRWDYRKKGKEFREKAGIYNDMQDKKNFKVHYRLYIESMDEAGKKLFFKCHEMYEGFVKYIPLPAGKERHKKG